MLVIFWCCSDQIKHNYCKQLELHFCCEPENKHCMCITVKRMCLCQVSWPVCAVSGGCSVFSRCVTVSWRSFCRSWCRWDTHAELLSFIMLGITEQTRVISPPGSEDGVGHRWAAGEASALKIFALYPYRPAAVLVWKHASHYQWF